MTANKIKTTIEKCNELPYYANVLYLANNYSESVRKDLFYVMENEHKIQEDEWKEMFEKHKTIPWSPVLQFMVSSKNVSDKMVDDIATHLIKGDYCGRLHDILERDRVLYLASERNISKTTMSAICYFFESRTDGFTNHLFVKKPEMNEENIETMAAIWLVKRASSKKKTMPTLLRYALEEVKSDSFVRDILKAYPNDEGIRGVLLQNQYISDDVKQQIYDMGIDPLSIQNMNKLPANIFSDMFESIVAAFDSEAVNPANYEKIKHTANKTDLQAYSAAKNKLYQMIVSGHLTEDREYELFQVMLSQELRSAHEITDAILRQTKNQRIFEEMHKLKSKSSYGDGLINPFVPKEYVDKYLESLSKKIETNYNKKKVYTLSGADANILKGLIKNDIPFPLPIYSALLVTETSKYDTMREMATVTEVPKVVLEKIYRNNRSALQSGHKHEAMIAKIRLDLYDFLTTEEQKILCDFLRTATRDDFVHKPESRYARSGKRNFYSTNKLNDELSGIMQKVIDVTENISDEDKNCKEEIEKIKNFAIDVKNTCENLKDWNLKECDPIYLENLQYKTSYYFTTQCHDSLAFYQNIEKFVNESKEIDDAISCQKENPSQEINER